MVARGDQSAADNVEAALVPLGVARTERARRVAEALESLPGDEPAGNLDEDTREEIVTLLEKLWRERGLTPVLVTTTVRSPGGRSVSA